MSRNRYDDAFGVVRVRWQAGAPSEDSGRIVLCEVWQSTLSINYVASTKPEVAVTAIQEIRVCEGGKWWSIGYGGDKREAKGGHVRRHAYLVSRSWRTTVALDGWSGE